MQRGSNSVNKKVRTAKKISAALVKKNTHPSIFGNGHKNKPNK